MEGSEQAKDKLEKNPVTLGGNEGEDELEQDLSDDNFFAEIDRELAHHGQEQEDGLEINLAQTEELSSVSLRNQSLLNRVLADKDAQAKAAILRTAYQAQLGKDDPLFVILLATGQLEWLLEEQPEQIKQLFQEWLAIFEQEREQIRLLLDDTEKVLQLKSKAALDVQKRNISKTVTELVRSAALEKVAHDAQALICAGLILLGAIGIGAILGFGVTKYAFSSEVELDPTGARQLTLQQATALNWEMSEQGQYARQLMEWNQTLLSKRGRSRLCEQEVKQLGITLELEGRRARSGYCLLWTKPLAQREFF